MWSISHGRREKGDAAIDASQSPEKMTPICLSGGKQSTAQQQEAPDGKQEGACRPLSFRSLSVIHLCACGQGHMHGTQTKSTFVGHEKRRASCHTDSDLERHGPDYGERDRIFGSRIDAPDQCLWIRPDFPGLSTQR